MRPRKLRLVVATAVSPGARMPMPPPKQAPQVGVETIAPASAKTSSRPSASASRQTLRLAGHDDHAHVGVHLAAAQDLGGLPQVGHRAVGAVADVDLVDARADRRRRAAPRCPASAGAPRAAAGASRSIAHGGRRAPRRGRCAPPSRACRCGPRGRPPSCRRPGRCPSPSPPRRPCWRRPAARRSSAPRRPSPTNSSTLPVPPLTPISASTARIRSLPDTQRPFVAA